MSNLFRANKKSNGLPFTPAATLDGNTWEQIRYLLVNDLLGLYYNVGDTKTITLKTGETLTMQLVSINHGAGTAGTYYPNHTADFISVELMDTTHVINSTLTTVGGWNDSEMRTYLNSTVYSRLPTDLKNIVVNKTHMRTEGNGGSNLVSASDMLWLPTSYEMFGVTYSMYKDDANHNIHYSIFPNAASRIKYNKSDPTTALKWWLSSPNVSYYNNFALVDVDGNADYAAVYNSLNVPLCLRIG